MKKILPILILVAVVLLGGGGGWYYATKVRSTAIADLAKAPRNYDGKIVTIAGEVTERTNLLVYKLFKLKDDSGEITVLTERGLPQVGEKLRVKGRVREMFAVGDTRMLAFEEVVEK